MFDFKRNVDYFIIQLYYFVSILGHHSVSNIKSAALEKTLGQNNILFHTSDGLPSTPLSEPLWVNPYALL